MSQSVVLTVRVDEKVKDTLEKLAKATRRSKSFLAAEAIERYVAEEADFIRAVEEGISAADRGDMVPHEEVLADFNRRRKADESR